jgi:hypothetical protein
MSCRRSKYDMASLLGDDTCPVDSQTQTQQLPGLAFVLRRSDGAPALTTQTTRPAAVEQEQEPPINTPREKTAKRRASEEEKDAATPRKRCRGKWRKPTYLVRKVGVETEVEASVDECH